MVLEKDENIISQPVFLQYYHLCTMVLSASDPSRMRIRCAADVGDFLFNCTYIYVIENMPEVFESRIQIYWTQFPTFHSRLSGIRPN